MIACDAGYDQIYLYSIFTNESGDSYSYIFIEQNSSASYIFIFCMKQGLNMR